MYTPIRLQNTSIDESLKNFNGFIYLYCTQHTTFNICSSLWVIFFVFFLHCCFVSCLCRVFNGILVSSSHNTLYPYINLYITLILLFVVRPQLNFCCFVILFYLSLSTLSFRLAYCFVRSLFRSLTLSSILRFSYYNLYDVHVSRTSSLLYIAHTSHFILRVLYGDAMRQPNEFILHSIRIEKESEQIFVCATVCVCHSTNRIEHFLLSYACVFIIIAYLTIFFYIY